jgi:hypothetical protein
LLCPYKETLRPVSLPESFNAHLRTRSSVRARARRHNLEAIGRHLTAGRQQLTAERVSSKPSTATDNCNCECHKTFDEVNKLLDAVPDLTNPTFRAWYCKAIYAMGCQAFLDLADEARKGRQPTKLFSSLLKARMGGKLK